MKINKNTLQIKNTLSILCNIAIIVFGIIGFLLKRHPFTATTLEYFTLDSNLFCVITCIICLFFQLKNIIINKTIAKKIPNWSVNLKYFSTCAVAVTFFVVLFVLVPMCANITCAGTNTQGTPIPATATSSSSAIQNLMQACPKDGSPAGIGLSLWTMFTQGTTLYHHLLVPILAILSLILVDQKTQSKTIITLAALIFPFIYYVVLGTLNCTGIVDGPYPFLQIPKMALWQNILWFVLLLIGCYVIAFAIFKLWTKHCKTKETL